METIKLIIFVIAGTALFLFLSWLIYNLTRRDISKVLRWVNIIVMICLSVSIVSWIIEKCATHKLFELSLPTGMILFNSLYALVDFTIWILLVKNRHCKSMRFRRGAERMQELLELQEHYSKPMLICTISLVLVPGLNVYSVYLLITETIINK